VCCCQQASKQAGVAGDGCGCSVLAVPSTAGNGHSRRVGQWGRVVVVGSWRSLGVGEDGQTARPWAFAMTAARANRCSPLTATGFLLGRRNGAPLLPGPPRFTLTLPLTRPERDMIAFPSHHLITSHHRIIAQQCLHPLPCPAVRCSPRSPRRVDVDAESPALVIGLSCAPALPRPPASVPPTTHHAPSAVHDLAGGNL
jgi:hypothetical protein